MFFYPLFLTLILVADIIVLVLQCRGNRSPLRKYITKGKEYQEKLSGNGSLPPSWNTTILPRIILDYYEKVGSIFDFTDDDFDAARENGFTTEAIIELIDKHF